MEVIPAIDLMSNRVVRLTKGEFSSAIDYGAPLEIAKKFEDAGIKRLHLVDLDGAKNGNPRHLSVLNRIATETDLIIDYGGGMRDTNDLRKAFDAGAALINLGSVCITMPEKVQEWLFTWGAEKFIIVADVRDGFVAYDGWQQQTKTTVNDIVASLSDFLPLCLLCTDISRDGDLKGPNVEFYRTLQKILPSQVDVIASGGVSNFQDLKDLSEAGVKKVVVGKALLEERITFREIGVLSGC